MRVYEFARQIGATYTSVLEMADAGEVEIYSPLSQLDADDVEALKREFQKVGEEAVKAKAAAADEKRKEKTAKAAKSAAEKDKVQFEELEAGRKRAAEAYKAHTGQSLEVKEAKPAAKKPVKKAEPKAKPVKIEVTPPPPPKISIQVSTVPEEKPVLFIISLLLCSLRNAVCQTMTG